MKEIIGLLLLILVLSYGFSIALSQVNLSASVRYNNHNIEHSNVSAPAWFLASPEGIYGELENGVLFTQKPVTTPSIKLEKFEIQDAYWYVSDKGRIDAESDLQALSIYLTL